MNNTNLFVTDNNAMVPFYKLSNHLPIMRNVVPGKLCTFGEGHPVAKILEVSKTDSKKVKIELMQDVITAGVVSFPKGYVAELDILSIRYLE